MKVEFNFSQSAVIPYRINNSEVEILLITTLKKKKWVVPKGFIEFNHSPFESAKKEAYEEAGVIGTNETVELGNYKVVKSAGVCFIRVYSMEVINILDEYPEKKLRDRKWFTIKEAAEVISIPELKNLILSMEPKFGSV